MGTKIWEELEHEIVVYTYIDWVREEWCSIVETMNFSNQKQSYSTLMNQYNSASRITTINDQRKRIEPTPEIIKGQGCMEKGNKFQPFLARIRSIEETKWFLDTLKKRN